MGGEVKETRGTRHLVGDLVQHDGDGGGHPERAARHERRRQRHPIGPLRRGAKGMAGGGIQSRGE